MNTEFQGKTLVISGGTRGIGKAIVYEFAKVGANIAFTYNSNAQIADEMVQDLEKNYKIKARAYEFNILEPETYKELLKKLMWILIEWIILSQMLSFQDVRL